MTAKQIIFPAHRAFNSDGAPEPLATAYLYLSGTTTPAVFYADAGLSVSLGSHLTANAAGRFVPHPYQDSTVAFRLIIEDAEGTVLDDIDPFFFGLQTGVDGVNASIAVGTTTDGVNGTPAVVTNSGTGTNAILNFTLPTGAQGPAGDVAKVATRTAMAAIIGPSAGIVRYLAEAGREGHFIYSTSNLSAFVTADPTQGIYVPPAVDTTGASGAWVRKFDGAAHLKWFGAVYGVNAGANAAANNTAHQGAVSILNALKNADLNGTIYAVRDLDLGYGHLEISAPIGATLAGTCKIIGHGTAGGSLNGSSGGTVIWAFGCSAFQLDQTRSSVSDLTINGDHSVSGGLTEAEYHGVAATQLVFCTNVRVCNMRGDGFNIDGQTSAGHLPDSSRLLGCEAWHCRDGVSIGVTGGSGDANVIQISGGIFNQNRRWGVNDQGFLGNTHISWEGATNGVQSSNDGVTYGASLVSYSGNLYGVIAGQEVGASTNAPSGDTTDNTWWYYKKAGGVSSGRPAWFSGMLVRAGGILYTNNINAPHVFLGCYAESDQGFAQVSRPAMVYGGTLAGYVWKGSTGVAEYVDTNGTKHLTRPLQFSDSYTGTDETINVTVGESSTTKSLLRFNSSVGAPSTWRLKFTGSTTGGLLFDYGNSSLQTTFQILGPNTADQAGTGAAFPYAFRPTALLVQPNVLIQSDNARRFMIDSAAPSTGAHGVGEWCLYRGTAANLVGWNCTTAGTPGTWQANYSLSAAPAAIATSGSASDLSTGTVPAARMPALTGDVTMTAGTTTTVIPAGQVTLSQLANMATASVFYRKTAGSGAPEVQSLAALKTDLGLTGTNSGDQTITLTGDVTGSGTGSFAATISGLALSKLAAISASTILGNNTGGSTAPIALTAAQTKSLLAISTSDVSGLGTIATHAAGDYVATPATLADQIAIAKTHGTGVVIDQGAPDLSHTGDTANTTVKTVTVPANTLLANGLVIVEADFSCPSNANNKSANIKWGSIGLTASTVTTTTGFQLSHRITNKNATNSQHVTSTGSSTGAITDKTEDTTANVDIAFQVQCGNSGDTITLKSYRVLVYPKS